MPSTKAYLDLPRADVRVQRTYAAIRENLRPTQVTLLSYLWEHQSEPDKITPAALRVHFRNKNDPAVAGSDLTRFRRAVADACEKLSTRECPLFLIVEAGTNAIRFRPRDAEVQVASAFELLELERIARPGVNRGQLLDHSEVMVYLHHAGELPEGLVARMLENMANGISYDYYLPLRYLSSSLDLLLHLVNEATDIRARTQLLQQRVRINIIAKEFPILFSIQNANKLSHAIMYVRCVPLGTFVRYCEEDLAGQKVEFFKELWKPQPRRRSDPVLLPCEGVELDAVTMEGLRNALSDRLLTKTAGTEDVENTINLLLPQPHA